MPTKPVKTVLRKLYGREYRPVSRSVLLWQARKRKAEKKALPKGDASPLEKNLFKTDPKPSQGHSNSPRIRNIFK